MSFGEEMQPLIEKSDNQRVDTQGLSYQTITQVSNFNAFYNSVIVDTTVLYFLSNFCFSKL
jgi:hypothetical protein